jgi:hypothetical protein
LIGETAADGKPLAVVEAVERALFDVLGNLRELGDVGAAHAAHDDA